MKKFDIVSRDFSDSLYENFSSFGEIPKVYLRDGRVIYFSEDTVKYNFFDFYDQCKDHCFLKDCDSPYLLYTGVGTIFSLIERIYKKEVVLQLNTRGLYIFLHEMLIFGAGKVRKLVPKPEWIKHKNEITYDKVEFNFIGDDVYSFELESIREFVINNSLNNVTVFVNEKIDERWVKTRYPEFKINTKNIWIETYDIFHQTPQLKTEKINSNFQFKFLSMNRRYEPHKHLITAFLINKKSQLSFLQFRREWDNKIFMSSFDYLNSQLPFDIDRKQSFYQRVKNNISILDTKVPLLLDCEKDKLDPTVFPSRCGTEEQLPLDAFQKTFCYVITESKFGQPFSYFSERPLISMAVARPFILVSTPHSLDYLKSYGFKTFDQWWDESYDQEQDHEKRMLKIFQVIDYIDSFDIQQLKEMYLEMQDVLEHNQNLVLSLDYRKFDFK